MTVNDPLNEKSVDAALPSAIDFGLISNKAKITRKRYEHHNPVLNDTMHTLGDTSDRFTAETNVVVPRKNRSVLRMNQSPMN